MALNIPSILPALDRAREQNELSRKLFEKGINDSIKGAGQFAMSYIERQKALEAQRQKDLEAQTIAGDEAPAYENFENSLEANQFVPFHKIYNPAFIGQLEQPQFAGHSIISKRFK